MLTIAIQAGGASRRMGADKALLPFWGQPLICRVMQRVAPIADEILVTTNHPADYCFLGVPLFPDVLPERGALGGLYTALLAARFPLVGLVACDMPFACAALLEAARDRLIETDADVAIPQTEDGYEPLHAVYRREACLPAVKAALDDGEQRLISWFSAVRVAAIPPEEIRQHDPTGLAFVNLNTPEELRQAEKMLTSQGPGR